MSVFWKTVTAGAKTKTGQKIISALKGDKQKTTGTEVIKKFKPLKKFEGQKTKESIIAAGKKKKEKIVNEDFKENMRRYFTNQPPKNPKKKVDEDLF